MATAVNVGQVDSAFGATPRTVSVPFTPTAGNSLIVIVTGGNFTGTRSLSDDGSNTWVQDYTATTLQVYRCASIGSVPTTLTAAWDGGSSGVVSFKCYEVSGLDGAGPDNTYATASTSWGADQATSVTTDESDDFVISSVELNAGRDTPFTAVGTGLSVFPTSGTGQYWGTAYGTLSASPTTANAGISVSPNLSGAYVVALVYSSGASAATLSSPTSASVTQTGATIGATTDDATGTLYGVVTTSASAPSATQIKAGQDHTGSAAAGSGSNASLSVGANTIAITGLTAATTYYYYLVQDNGSDSNVVNGTFTTAVAAPVISVFTILNEDADGFDIRFTTDTGNGTAYYVVYPTSASDPSATQIVAGTDGDAGAALASGNMAVSATGVQTFPSVNGLSSGVTYRVAVVHYGVPA